MSAAAAAARRVSAILLVEDDRVSREALAGILRLKRFKVDVAATLAEAKQSLEAFMPDVVLLDLMLPDGSGLEILRRIKESGPDVAVAVISGAADAMIESAKAMGADAVFQKPLSAAKILKWIEGE